MLDATEQAAVDKGWPVRLQPPRVVDRLVRSVFLVRPVLELHLVRHRSAVRRDHPDGGRGRVLEVPAGPGRRDDVGQPAHRRVEHVAPGASRPTFTRPADLERRRLTRQRDGPRLASDMLDEPGQHPLAGPDVVQTVAVRIPRGHGDIVAAPEPPADPLAPSPAVPVKGVHEAVWPSQRGVVVPTAAEFQLVPALRAVHVRLPRTPAAGRRRSRGPPGCSTPRTGARCRSAPARRTSR